MFGLRVGGPRYGRSLNPVQACDVPKASAGAVEPVPVEVGVAIAVRQVSQKRCDQDALVVGLDAMPFNVGSISRCAVNDALSGTPLSIVSCEASEVVGGCKRQNLIELVGVDGEVVPISQQFVAISPLTRPTALPF